MRDQISERWGYYADYIGSYFGSKAMAEERKDFAKACWNKVYGSNPRCFKEDVFAFGEAGRQRL